MLGYTRVSTEKQVEGSSLKTQKETITKYCKENGHELVHIFTDEGLSGKRGSKRPQYNNMLKRLKDDAEVEGIVVASLSRLGRSLPDVLTLVVSLQESNRVFVSVKEHFDMTTKEGRMLFGVMAVINEYETELIRERMRDGRAYAEMHGSKSGKPCHRPRKEIDWHLVEVMRQYNASWSAISKALAANPETKVAKSTLLAQARERGMKMD